MSSLVYLDPKGIIGPVATLINNYELLNELGLSKLVTLIVENFKNITNKSLDENEMLNACRSNQPNINTLLSSEIFQSMIKQDSDQELYSLLNENLITNMLETYKMKHDLIIKDWIIRLLEGYLTPEKIRNLSDLKSDKKAKEISDFRKEIGTSIYHDASSGDLKIDHFNRILGLLKHAMDKNLDNKVLEYLGKYLLLFSMSEDPKSLSDNLYLMLNDEFRKKMFPKSTKL